MKKNPLPISVAIIARNEEENLKRLLPSITGFAEEIILVHNDCTDDTVSIAKSHGAKCFENKWVGHVEQKNFALTKCRSDWILSLDADEAISEKLRSSIYGFFKNENAQKSVGGLYFNRCSFFLGKWIRHGDWYPDRKLRLIRNGKAKWVGKNPHDKLQLNDSLKSHFLIGDLEHYSFRDVRSLSEKSLVYSDIFIKNFDQNRRVQLLLFAVLRAVWRFFRCYILRLGFMDGSVGFVIAFSVAYETLIKHSRSWELQDKKK